MNENVDNVENSETEGSHAAARQKLGAADFAVFILCIVLAVAGASMTFWGGFNLGFSISYAILFLILTFYLARKRSEYRPGVFEYLCGIASLLCAAVPAICSIFSVKFFSVILCLFTGALWFASLGGWVSRRRKGDFAPLATWGESLFPNLFGGVGFSMRAVFSGSDGKNKGFLRALLGVLISLPVLFVIVPLLIRSDAAFEGLVSSVFTDIPGVIARLLVGLLIAPFLVSYAISLRHKEPLPVREKEPRRGLDPILVNAFLATISVIYLIYLFSQLAYFFNAFSGLIPAGEEMTAANYARRGFGEMCVIAVIDLALVILALSLVRKKPDGRANVLTKILCIFISLFTLLITATAFSKMYLYIQRFGLTRLRVLTSVFMAVLAVVFLALIARCFIRKVPVMSIGIIAAALALFITGVSGLDGRIADYNINAYKTGKLASLDTEAITKLDYGAVPYLTELAAEGRLKGSAKETVENGISAFASRLMDHSDDGEFTEKKEGFECWNMEKAAAARAIAGYIEAHPDDVHYVGYNPFRDLDSFFFG
ncbi:MAG: DUF4173 domain-containing protein [Synergistes sp.]|nr:DUF4173 domain-containing protein [Synergistes sp.]